MASFLSRWAESIRSLVISPVNAKDPALARLFDGGPVAAGVPVNEWNALTYSAVWAAVGQISSTVASLPLKLYKRLPDGGKEPFSGHRLYELLHDNPNPEMTSFVWRQISQAHLETWGNAYAEIERDFAGRPVAIWPIPPDRVEPVRDERDRLVYRVRGVARMGDVIIPAADMLHVPGLGFDGMKGYGVVQMARESIGLGLAAERFGATFFGNGSTFGGFLSHPKSLSPEAQQNLKESLAKHAGPTKAHRILLLQENMTFIERKGIPPNDAQFLESRLFQVQEVARWLRISPYKLGDLSRATFSNIEHQAIEYYTDTIRPRLVGWEQEINRKLIAPLERRQQFCEFVIEGALRGDIQTRYAAYAMGRQWGFLSADDIRANENMNPLPGGQGQIFLIPMNMVPANRINEIIDKQVAPDPKPVAPPPAAGSGQSDDQMNSLKRAIDVLDARLPELTAEAEEARAAALMAREALAASTGVSVDLRIALATAEAKSAEADEARHAALTALALANEAKDRQEARAVEAEREAEDLKLQRDGLDVALAAAIVGQDKAAKERDAAEAARAQAEAASVEAQAAAAAAQDERDAARQSVEAKEAEAAELQARIRTLADDVVQRTADLEAETLASGERDAAKQAELDQVRAELAGKVAEADVLSASRAELMAGLERTEAARVEAEAKLAAAQEAEAMRAAEAEQLAAQHQEAVASVESLTARLVETQAQIVVRDERSAQQDSELAAAAAREAEQAAAIQAVTDKHVQVEDELASVAEARDLALAEAQRAAEALAERERQAAELAAELAAVAAREAEQVAASREAAERQAQAEGQLAGVAEARDQAILEAREAEARLAAGRGALVSAHRSLYQDAMSRLIEREIDRILGARSSANKLRTVMGPFYDRHLELVSRDLVPLVRVHLAFLRRDEDPEALAADLAEQHVARSRADLAEVYESDADEFPTQLSQMIQRWRAKRTSDLAEHLMRREIEHG